MDETTLRRALAGVWASSACRTRKRRASSEKRRKARLATMARGRSRTLRLHILGIGGQADWHPALRPSVSRAPRWPWRSPQALSYRRYSKEIALMFECFERVGYSADIDGLEREFGHTFTELPGWARRHARPNGR